MTQKKQLIILVIVILAIAVFWVIVLYPPKNPPKNQNANNMPVKVKTVPPEMPTPVYAPAGQVVSGFPQDLILDPNAQAAQSYAINYATSTKQYTVVWNSASSMDTMYKKYLEYFSASANGWQITNKFTTSPTVHGLYATQPSAQVNVTIEAQKAGSKVTVGYLSLSQ